MGGRLTLFALVLLAALSGAACATSSGGGGGFVAGCYGSATSTDSIIFNGQMGTYKNAQFAIDNGTCGSDPVNDYVTLVTAPDQSSALASCQAEADPAADVAEQLNTLGFMVPANVWFCTNPLSGRLLQVGECYAIGTASVGMSEIRMRRLSRAHWPIKPSPSRTACA